MRFATCAAGVLAIAVLGVAGCAPSVPDSGVGFQSYPDYVRSREAGLNGTGPANGGGAYQQPTIAGPGVTSQPIGSSLPPVENRDSIPAGIARQSGEMAGQPGFAAPAAGISDEQEFSAVSSRETIESDKARLAAQRAEYQEIRPVALPQRDGNDGPNIVEFAISSRNQVGEQIYSRNNPFRDKQSPKACAKFASSDLAQEQFLANGGPDRDGKSLDPDGDGFACAWDPSPFRTAVR